jgi:23S rRNA pseudouridine1911/1915/1917 synthase
VSESSTEPVHVEAGPDDAGIRLDRLLAARVADVSRVRVQALIRTGAVKIAARTISDPGYRVKSGERISLILPAPEPATPLAQSIPLAIVYEDDQLIVVDKPAGLVVHPAPGHRDGTLVNALLAHCGASLSGIGGVARPGIVHRLDKDTSGLLVVAKTDRAHRHLAAQFEAKGQDGRLSRRYLAIVWGRPSKKSGRIETRLARSSRDRTRIGVARGNIGRSAVTHYVLMETFVDAKGVPLASLLELELETGRTHQIRVHMQHLGHPLVGDPVYGSGFKSSEAKLCAAARAWISQLPGQALHAAELGFEHPISHRNLSFQTPPPAAFSGLLAALGSTRPAAPASDEKLRRRKSRP